jgi:hypothetical protein
MKNVITRNPKSLEWEFFMVETCPNGVKFDSFKKTLFNITKQCDDIFKTLMFCMSYGDLKGWHKICQNDFDCSKCQFEGTNHDKLKNLI